MITFKEDKHYKQDDFAKKYTCLNCYKMFPFEYSAMSRRRDRKRFGTRQLMSIYAWNNFKKHLKSCWGSK